LESEIIVVVSVFNQCMAIRNQPPTNKAFSHLNSTVLHAMDQRGASYTSRFGDMRAYHGTSAVRQRGNNTGLITPHIFHGNVGDHAGAASASASAHGSSLSFDTDNFKDN
jgi:hypothetical protein